MEIFLVRHGDAARNTPENYNAMLNYPDPELTKAGETQAEQLGERLRSVPLQRIYTSDLTRARQTAEILADYNGAPVEVRAALREINMGRLFTETWEEIEQEMPGYAARWLRHDSDLPYPGGECGADVIFRCKPLVNQVVQDSVEYAGEAPDSPRQPYRVVFLTHGGTIRSLLCGFLGISPEKRFLFGAPLENCGLSVVRWDSRRQIFLVHSVNDTAHLR